MVNTDKGRDLFGEIQDDFNLIPSSLEWAATENPNLSHPTSRPKGRDEAFKLAFSNPEEYIKKYSDKRHFMKLMKFTLKRHVKSTPWLYELLLNFK